MLHLERFIRDHISVSSFDEDGHPLEAEVHYADRFVSISSGTRLIDLTEECACRIETSPDT